MMNKILIGTAAAVAAMAVSTAYATPTLTLSDGTTTQTGTLGAGGSDVYVGTVGPEWTVNVTTGLPNHSGQPILDLNSIDSTVGGGGTLPSTLTIILTENGYSLSAGSLMASIGGTLASGWTLVYETFLNSTPETTQTFTGNGGSFAGDLSAPTGAISPTDVLKEEVLITATSESSASFDASITTAPDGGMTILMLGAGFLGLAGLRSRFSKQS